MQSTNKVPLSGIAALLTLIGCGSQQKIERSLLPPQGISLSADGKFYPPISQLNDVVAGISVHISPLTKDKIHLEDVLIDGNRQGLPDPETLTSGDLVYRLAAAPHHFHEGVHRMKVVGSYDNKRGILATGWFVTDRTPPRLQWKITGDQIDVNMIDNYPLGNGFISVQNVLPPGSDLWTKGLGIRTFDFAYQKDSFDPNNPKESYHSDSLKFPLPLRIENVVLLGRDGSSNYSAVPLSDHPNDQVKKYISQYQ